MNENSLGEYFWVKIIRNVAASHRKLVILVRRTLVLLRILFCCQRLASPSCETIRGLLPDPKQSERRAIRLRHGLATCTTREPVYGPESIRNYDIPKIIFG